MKIAITGGTGFVGSHLARALAAGGHQVVIAARNAGRRAASLADLPGVQVYVVGLESEFLLAEMFAGCDAVAHCAGINREFGAESYQRVHIDGTRNVVAAARRAGVHKVALLSFLRARPQCGSGYHESKWAAEEIVRAAAGQGDLAYTILKAGVIYGRGDHMLGHLSHAFHTFPLFALVGMRDQRIRPVAVEDVVAVLHAALIESRLDGQTVSVLGPEELTLRAAVTRVARVVGRTPWMFRAPLWFHYAMARVLERAMTIPLVSSAQVRILSEGIVEALPPCDSLPHDLLPRIPFSDEQIRRGLPGAKSFGLQDCRIFARRERAAEPANAASST